MFSSKTQLKKRTPENESDRESYLSLLVDEFINSSSYDAKSQVLANLANFAYDPINFEYIRNVGVLDIFFHVLKNEQNNLIHFAASGICNLCIDPLNVDYILSNGNLKHVCKLLNSEHDETIADAITIFIYLHDSHAQSTIKELNLQNHIETLTKSSNKIISNLACVFLENLRKTD